MASPEEERKATEAREANEQLERQYQRCFQTAEGRAVLADLVKYCMADESTYVAGCTDAMLINEGCRRVFLRIVQKTRMDMTNFYIQRDKELARRRRRLP